MKRYACKELSYEVPDRWEDQTIVAWAAPSERIGQAQPNVVITLDKVRSGETLRTYVTRHVADISKSLHDFALEETRDVTLSGQPAIEIRFTWVGATGKLAQRQVIAAYRETIYNVTTSCLAVDAVAAGTQFDAIFAALQFGGAVASPSPRKS